MEVFLGVALVQAREPVASMYSVASTHAGGALLWGSTEFVSVLALIPIFVQWMRSDEREARRVDARLDRAAAARADAGPGAPDGSPVVAAAPSGSGAGGRPLSAWEAEWLARTGRVPTQDPVA
jgi:hypothetical protein